MYVCMHVYVCVCVCMLCVCVNVRDCVLTGHDASALAFLSLSLCCSRVGECAALYLPLLVVSVVCVAFSAA